MASSVGPVATAVAPDRAPDPALLRYGSFPDVLKLVRDMRDMTLLFDIETYVRVVRYAPGRIEFEPAPGAQPSLAARMAERLQTFTGQRWAISVVADGGQPSVAEVRATERNDAHARARQNPLVQAVMSAFPKAKIRDVRPAATETAADPGADAPPDDWDPFEES
jgi:DNA polymerase-3 subunit gamma/tau